MKEYINKLGSEKRPFFFIISYDMSESIVVPFDELDDSIKFEMDGFGISEKRQKTDQKTFIFEKFPQDFEIYSNKFNLLQNEIRAGNTYLANLTMPTPISSNLSLLDIYEQSKAKFKLYFKDIFVVFSPERFIKIKDNIIETFPMKGTIDASVKNAKEKILNNQKELAEHTMVVDLLRNDLSIIAKKVKVERFRYIDEVKTAQKTLLQVSSHIKGELEDNWSEHIGTILFSLLPAGSITGAPKKKSVEILKKIENYDRGFFSGVFGYFDGKELDCAVMIRFIEKKDNKLIFKSGGGITADSDARQEYNELIEKVYVPIY
ncbi:MAG: para-aminobenzoate synthetase component [Campylobacterota bacterium]|nr:para-aminobenzoate synthetase component [Campylobacterota bacterium]